MKRNRDGTWRRLKGAPVTRDSTKQLLEHGYRYIHAPERLRTPEEAFGTPVPVVAPPPPVPVAPPPAEPFFRFTAKSPDIYEILHNWERVIADRNADGDQRRAGILRGLARLTTQYGFTLDQALAFETIVSLDYITSAIQDIENEIGRTH
jgi:hypothetical protein